MSNQAELIYFEQKTVPRDFYKNTHIRFGYTKDTEPIFVFMVPSCGNTPGIPFDDDVGDQHRMMDLVLDDLIKNPTKETTNLFFKKVPLIFHDNDIQRIYYLDDKNNKCFNHMNKDELEFFFIRVKKRLNKDDIITFIGYQTFN